MWWSVWGRSTHGFYLFYLDSQSAPVAYHWPTRASAVYNARERSWGRACLTLRSREAVALRHIITWIFTLRVI